MSSSVRISRRASLKAGAAGVAAVAAGATLLNAVAQDATPAAGAVPAIITSFLDAFAGEDVDAVLALFTADAKFELAGIGVELNGQDELRFLHESQFEQHDDIAFTDVTGFEAAGHVAAEGTWTSTNLYDAPNSNEGPEEITYEFALIGDVTEGGQFSRLTMYWDTFQVNVQLGISEAIPVGTPPPA